MCYCVEFRYNINYNFFVIIQVYHSAIKSKVLDKMTLIQNGVDDIRRNATMYINPTNNGGSGIHDEVTNSSAGRNNG